LGSGLDADIVVVSGKLAARGVRVRRSGGEVEIQRLDPGVVVTIDGRRVESDVTVSLGSVVVTIDGVLLTDDMVPQDTIAAGELPDSFAPIIIGRAPDCSFIIDNPAVSAHHARITREQGGVLLEDLDSANGTFVDDRRIKRMRLGWRQAFELSTVRLTPLEVVRQVHSSVGGAETQLVKGLMHDPTNRPGGPEAISGSALSADMGDLGGRPVLELKQGQSIIIGRDPSADIVLDTPNISRLHARLERVRRGIRVEDLGSTNGTWVNGERLARPTILKPGDDLRLGPHPIELTKDLKVIGAAVGQGGVRGVRVDVAGLMREVGRGKARKVIVDDVSFSVLPGEMVAIMGPSGAGKTSVLTSLAGYTAPTSGVVFLDGLNLYGQYDVFRSAIGYVPQEDVMHRTLTVQEVLYYHAKISYPTELRDEEIERRIDTVLRRLDLDGVRDSIVGDDVRRGLSGGQRKRLNVAMELLSEPSLLLLDEPTSGLDARSAMQLIRQCRGLANSGRTVVMTIHQPRREAFHLFDKLLLLSKGGKVAYFGPGREARQYFQTRSDVPPSTAQNPADYVVDVLDPIEPALGKPPDEWRDAFRESPEYHRFVSRRLKKEEKKYAKKAARKRGTRRAPAVGQFVQLTRRYTLLKLRDRVALAVQLVQAPVIGILALLLFRDALFEPQTMRNEISPVLFVIVSAAVWFGCSNVAREIVGERAIFRRERMGSLRPGPYLASKMVVQGVLIAIQVGILLALLVPLVPLKGPLHLLILVPLVAGLSAMAMGLFISTIARTELGAMQYVPLAVLPQIILSGVLMPVEGAKATALAVWMSKPMLLRWAYGAYTRIEIFDTLGPKKGLERHFPIVAEHIGFMNDSVVADIDIMLGIGIALTAATWAILRSRDRG
jgi:ABC-type multidrug transport system ATPase subunit